MTYHLQPKRLYLASESPRRSELMAQLNLDFKVFSVPIDEQIFKGEAPDAYVERMAFSKAKSALVELDADFDWVVGGDTAVIIGGKILGKPKDEAHTMEMLEQLSGKRHFVLSAVALANGDTIRSKVCRTEVSFKVLSNDEIKQYIDSKEPFGKAGAYAIQGFGASFVEHINGSYSGVMGLPLFELNQLLEKSGYK